MGERAARLMGAKSFSESYGSFLKRPGLIERLPTNPSSSVCPSGGALATISDPTMPFAATRLSTITGCPTRSASLSPTARATVSLTPPGGLSAITRIGRSGYSAQAAAVLIAATAHSSAADLTRIFNIVLLHSGAALPAAAHVMRVIRTSASGGSALDHGRRVDRILLQRLIRQLDPQPWSLGQLEIAVRQVERRRDEIALELRRADHFSNRVNVRIRARKMRLGGRFQARADALTDDELDPRRFRNVDDLARGDISTHFADLDLDRIRGAGHDQPMCILGRMHALVGEDG